MTLPIYVFNLKDRSDRRMFIKNEFANKCDFDVTIVEAFRHEIGAIGLWESIKKVVFSAKKNNKNFIIICEDDHQFTDHYNFDLLKICIQKAQTLDVDILSGGVSWFETGVQITKNLFWVEKFSGLQFTIIFKKFYQKILEVTDFGEHDASDYKISDLTDKKFVIYPFISIQKDFGYSDVTAKNNQEGRVEKLFEDTSERFELLKKVRNFYLPEFKRWNMSDFDNIILPVYIINLKERPERLVNVLQQFEDKPEFKLHITEAIRHNIGAVGLWQTMRRCIQEGLENDDDLIIICEDDHTFTEHYNRDVFIQNILGAHEQGCDVLSAGIGGFHHAVPITANRYWVDSFWCTQFIVVYRKLFQAILDEPFDDSVTSDDKISEMTRQQNGTISFYVCAA